MATKKTTKKSVTKKITNVKKPVVKKIKSVSKHDRPKLVGLRREEEPFLTFRFNRQTIYWTIFGAVVILFTMWILQLQMDIQALYDEIDASNTELLSDPDIRE